VYILSTTDNTTEAEELPAADEAEECHELGFRWLPMPLNYCRNMDL